MAEMHKDLEELKQEHHVQIPSSIYCVVDPGHCPSHFEKNTPGQTLRIGNKVTKAPFTRIRIPL